MEIAEKAEACKARLAEMRGWHFREIAEYDCGHCDDLWPCDAALLLDYAEARVAHALECFSLRDQLSPADGTTRAGVIHDAADDAEDEVESLYQFLHRKE